MKVDCNRIMISDEDMNVNAKGNRLRVVKDSCVGCRIDKQYCALNYLFEDAGLVKEWEKWDLPNFREVTKQVEKLREFAERG